MYLSRPVTRAMTLIISASLIPVAACKDLGREKPTRPQVDNSIPSAQEVTEERSPLKEVTRLVAQALADGDVRTQVRDAMRESPYREHKLHFTRFLSSQTGEALVRAMAQLDSSPPDEIRDLVAGIRELEFYMPGDQHRMTWTGGAEVIVASLLEDHTIPDAYDVSGNPFEFKSAEVLPEQPVLALVPVETNFDSPPPTGTLRNTHSEGGRAIGVYESVSSYSGSGCSGPNCVSLNVSPSRPTGIYMTDVYIPDDHEGALKGDPEFETHLIAPDPQTLDTTKITPLRCAGEHASDPNSVYDQNGAFFEGEILVASETELDEHELSFGADDFGMSIVGWEDDDTACEVKADEDRFRDALVAVGNAYGDVDAVIQQDSPDADAIVKALRAIRDAVLEVASWLKSNDDIVGTRAEETCSLPDGTSGNFVVVDGDSNGTTVKGCSKLVAHVYGPVANITGATSYSAGKDTLIYDSNPSGGVGAYSYQWEVYWKNLDTWETLGTDRYQTVSLEPGSGDFRLHVEVSDGDQTGEDYLWVACDNCEDITPQ